LETFLSARDASIVAAVGYNTNVRAIMRKL
jgi:hypothetical protein